MRRLAFVRSEYENCLYIRNTVKGKTYILLYVDDLLLASEDEDDVKYVKETLNKFFKMKDLGMVREYLGISITQNLEKGELTMNQTKSLEVLLKKCNMYECRAVSTPMEENFDNSLLKADKSDSAELEGRCRVVIGSLMYIMLCTRPDLCFSINILSRYQSCATENLWVAIKRVLRYIKGTIKLSLIFKREINVSKDDSIICFSDADWAGDRVDRKSTSGYVFKMYNNTIAWASRKQTLTVALSSAESEYIALSVAACEACWIRGVFASLEERWVTVKMFEDNQSVIKVCKNPLSNHRLKHIDIKLCFVRDKIVDKVISVQYVSTNDQTGDVFTKPLKKVKFEKFRDDLGLI